MPLAVSSNEALLAGAYLLATLAVTSGTYFLVMVLAAARFRSGRPATPASPRPPLSVLVPVSGHEPRLLANLEAALAALDAGDELLVGAASSQDPALEAARELARKSGDARLTVVAGSESRATNRKVATLEPLAARARGEILVLVDSDVRLDRELVARLVAPLADPEVGIATALYRGVPARGLAARIEALAINADFVPSVLVASTLGGGIRFALGAANAVRRSALEAIGGIGSLGEVLADDHHLGKRIAATGVGVAIAPAVVPIVQDSSARDSFARLLRWCRTVRVCQPAGYAATVVSHHGVAASLGALALATLALGAPPAWALAIAAGTVALRLVTGLAAHALIAGREADLASFLLLPVRDLIATALFLVAWTGRSVTWRGRRFLVLADGTMQELERHSLATESTEKAERKPLLSVPSVTSVAKN